MTASTPNPGATVAAAPPATLRVFVVVPCYRAADELASCLDSLARQTRPFDAVVVDDASASEAVDRVVAAFEDDARFTIVRRTERGGPAAARATALAEIAEIGNDDDIVVLVDGDDRLIRDDALAIIADAYERDPQVRMTFGGVSVDGSLPYDDRPYTDWQLDLGLTAWSRWRAHHPRSFCLGHYRAHADRVRVRWPNGNWLAGATDIGLVLPLLEQCRAAEVRQLDTALYGYRVARDDGRTLHRSWRGRLRQLAGEWRARGPAAFPVALAWTYSPKFVKRATEPLLDTFGSWLSGGGRRGDSPDDGGQ